MRVTWSKHIHNPYTVQFRLRQEPCLVAVMTCIHVLVLLTGIRDFIGHGYNFFFFFFLIRAA